MPVLNNPVQTRFEIMKTLYRLSNQSPNKIIKLDAAQIEGGYYAEILYQLRFLSERGLIQFNSNFISRKFRSALTEEGLTLMKEAYHALTLKEQEREELLDRVFAKLKA